MKCILRRGAESDLSAQRVESLSVGGCRRATSGRSKEKTKKKSAGLLTVRHAFITHQENETKQEPVNEQIRCRIQHSSEQCNPPVCYANACLMLKRRKMGIIKTKNQGGYKSGEGESRGHHGKWCQFRSEIAIFGC